jgi:hypothetical protein
MNKRQGPPRWAEALLELLVGGRDRDVVVGDLREEYLEAKLPQRGRMGADAWYLRQALSFVPWTARRRGPMKFLMAVSWFTLAATCWLAVMDVVLRHPGYVMQAAAALGLGLISVATIAMLRLQVGATRERWLWAGALVLLGVGVPAFWQNARAAHFEGYIFLISLALALQGLLMLVLLGRSRGKGSRGLS